MFIKKIVMNRKAKSVPKQQNTPRKGEVSVSEQ